MSLGMSLGHRWLWAGIVGLAGAGLAGAGLANPAAPAEPPSAPAAEAEASQQHWLCEVVYLPARSTWRRTLTLVFDAQRVQAVWVDGQPVYTFQVLDTAVATALDNERIRFDPATRQWQSDFRGRASGQGRCEPQP